MQCQTTEYTQAPILSVTLSVTPSVTLTESLSVSFFHITIYIRHSVSMSTSHKADIIVYVLCFYITKSWCIDMLDSITMQCQTTECTQAAILSVTLSVTLSIMFFHDAMCISHSVTPYVTLTESLSVSFFHTTIYIRHSVSLSTLQRYRNIHNIVRRIYSLHSVTVYDCKSSRDNVRSCNVRIH